MRAITHALLAGCVLPQGPIIDLGCGGGRMLTELKRVYPDRGLCGVDLHPQALAHAKATMRCGASLTQAHLHNLPFSSGSFALCLALDVYDQQGVDLEPALAESWRILCPGGILLLRVSAHPWLYGPHDAAFNTGQRYQRQDMLSTLQMDGYRLLRVTYANTLLSVPTGALRLLQRWRMVPFLPSLYTTRGLNALLEIALKCEAQWLRRRDLPGGMSLYVVACKA